MVTKLGMENMGSLRSPKFRRDKTAHSLGVTSFGISTVSSYVGTVVTTTDASLRKSRVITNALGLLIRVDEPTGISTNADADLGAIGTPNQPTVYKYSPQGKMVQVTQGVQNRYFKYDSLGRLIRVKQPEQETNSGLNLADDFNTAGQWTAGFTYDVLGNVMTATDAKGTVITNTYDNASRVTTRSYSDTTPPVSFYYDGKGLAQVQSPNFAKGKLTKVFSTVSETKNTIFDNFGRLKETQQITDGNTYTSKYTYNLSGALVEEEYPSGRKVKNEFESDGDLSRIYGKATATATERTYANAFSYTPDGKIEKLKLGNGLWEAAKFNTRLQTTEIALGHGVTSGDLWKLGYEYGELNTDGSVSTAKNTGNIAKQTVSFNGLAQPFVQSYKYDSLYRLKEARETAGSSTSAPQTWIQQFGYDIYGNRISTAQTVNAVNINMTPAVDQYTNRFTSTDFHYDKNGNLTQDKGQNNQTRTIIFNGDNKQTQVRDANGNPIGIYFYDGEGKRVKKVVGNDTTIFVYSSGKLVAEYTTETPPSNPTTSYTATDMLGSPRVLTNSLGEVVSRRDFLPFGEELYADGTHRTTVGKYSVTGQDSVRKRFTGYEKDIETGLDFAEARMYENRYGRFTAVDPKLASGQSGNPQTFNRYVYTMNRPLILTDSTGLQAGCPAGVPGTGCAEDIIRVITIWSRTLNNYLTYDGGYYESDQLPAGTRYRERYTSRGPVPDFVQPGVPTGDAIKTFNKAMDDLNENLIQKVPLLSNLVNAQMAGINNDKLGVAKEMAMFEVDLATTVATGGTSKAAKGISVIGPRATYRQFAEKIGANFLDVTDKAWSWAKNEKFLAGIVKRGDDVVFAGKFNPNRLKQGTPLADEINYLIEHGYQWADDFSKLIKK